ncbi:MAG: hypothetical protein ACOYL6_04480 [Bacteriovoracaceae bacterium]
MKKLLPVALALLAIACNNGKQAGGGSIDSSGGSSPVSVSSATQTETTVVKQETKAVLESSPEEKFCDKGQIFHLDFRVDKDLLSYDGKLKDDVPVSIYFQDGQALDKAQVDATKVHCIVTAHINKRTTHLFRSYYRIKSQMAPQDGIDKKDGKAVCRQELENPPKLKNGQGFSDAITCLGNFDLKYTIDDVVHAIGRENLMVQAPVKK